MFKETLKLALEAFEYIEHNYMSLPAPAEKAITALREALAEQPATTETNGGKTGWPPGLLQDDCKGLSKWLSNKPDAKRRVREALDKMAENARELGLDYEPAKDNSNYRFDPPGLDPSHQKPVTPTAVEMQNASANLALMREMWGNSDEPAAKVNDDGFIVETGLLLSPGTQLYTSPPAQRKPLTPGQKQQLAENWFAEDWAITKAIGMMIDHERLLGIKEHA